MSLVIRHGRVIDPATDTDRIADVLIEEERITAIAPDIDSDAEAEIDAQDCLVVPGLIDMHVHFREPGYEHKEDIDSGSRSAVAGGFTAVACMANTMPVNDSAEVTVLIRQHSEASGLCRVYPIAAVTKNLEGRELTDFFALREAGAIAFSDDGMPIMDGEVMEQALRAAMEHDRLLIAHEENFDLVESGVMHHGKVSESLGLPGIPSEAEESMIARDIQLIERNGGSLHVAHLSTEGSAQLVRQAKDRGLSITAEVTPHHLFLTDASVEEFGSNAKMNPPLRSEKDVAALREALRDGTIDVIATDHAPHHMDEKSGEFALAPNGVVGLETALPLILELVRSELLSLATMVRAMSVMPSRLLGLAESCITPGAIADLTVIDPEKEWLVDPNKFYSKSINSPFANRQIKGGAKATIVAGRVVWRDGIFSPRSMQSTEAEE